MLKQTLGLILFCIVLSQATIAGPYSRVVKDTSKGDVEVSQNISQKAKDYVQTLPKGTFRLFIFGDDECPACLALRPTLNELSKNYPSVTFLNLRYDSDSTLFNIFNISSIPIMFLFNKDNQYIETIHSHKDFIDHTKWKGTPEELAEVQKNAKPDKEMYKLIEARLIKTLDPNQTN